MHAFLFHKFVLCNCLKVRSVGILKGNEEHKPAQHGVWTLTYSIPNVTSPRHGILLQHKVLNLQVFL